MPRIAGLLQQHFDLMLRWNKTHNLTRIVDPAKAATLHYVDSLIPLLGLPPRPKVLDIGSGNGLPGIAAAALWPQSEVTLLDSVAKKVSFLKAAKAELKLTNLTAIHSRCEALSEHHADLIVTRATFPWPKVPGFCARHLSEDGQLLAYFGKDAPDADEWKTVVSAAGLSSAEILPYALPDRQISRSCGVALGADPKTP